MKKSSTVLKEKLSERIAAVSLLYFEEMLYRSLRRHFERCSAAAVAAALATAEYWASNDRPLREAPSLLRQVRRLGRIAKRKPALSRTERHDAMHAFLKARRYGTGTGVGPAEKW